MSDNKATLSNEQIGLLIHLDERSHIELIRESSRGTYQPFTEALRAYDFDKHQVSIALLSFSDGTLNYIALSKRGNKVVTSKYRVEFFELINLQDLSTHAFSSRLAPENIRDYFPHQPNRPEVVMPPLILQQVLDVIKELRPKIAVEIDRLISLSKYAGYTLTGDAADVLLQEREAIGAALDIFSGGGELRREILQTWTPSDSSVENVNLQTKEAELKATNDLPSFLDGVSKRRFSEESAIQHDLSNWDGLGLPNRAGITTFHLGSGHRRLTLFYANRTSIEKALGVDLVYFNERFGMFVLVQYKLMSEKNNKSEFVYRPDRQLKEELRRMNYYYNTYKCTSPIQADKEFRLSDDGFLFKLVPNTGLQPAVGELISGMYLTREYANFLFGPHGPKGKNGGSAITEENAPRYLSNTEFTSNVRSGWIGTSTPLSNAIEEVIKATYYESGNTVIVAHEY